MRILYYNEGEDPNEWLPKLAAALPEAERSMTMPTTAAFSTSTTGE